MRLPRASLALLALFALASSACSGGAEKKASAEPAPSSTGDTKVAEGTVAPAPPPAAPLTGVVSEAGVAQRPALAVKIDNAPKARPQSGLDVADMVFEEVVEGGVTRFIAVFHSGAPEPVGPIRSVRPMDPNILSAFRGLVAYSGGIPEFVSLMRQAPVQDLNFDNAPSAYHRQKGKVSPHNLFASPEALWAMAGDGNKTPPPAMFEYRANGEPFGEADAASVRVPYSKFASPAYAWDPATGTWLRSQDGAPHMAASGAQIAPTNLVIQFVSTRSLGYKDRSGNSVTESIVVGDGDAWVLSGGRVAKGRWSKPDANSVTRYTDAAGNPVKLAPGKTWVHYVPVGSPVTTG